VVYSPLRTGDLAGVPEGTRSYYVVAGGSTTAVMNNAEGTLRLTGAAAGTVTIRLAIAASSDYAASPVVNDNSDEGTLTVAKKALTTPVVTVLTHDDGTNSVGSLGLSNYPAALASLTAYTGTDLVYVVTEGANAPGSSLTGLDAGSYTVKVQPSAANTGWFGDSAASAAAVIKEPPCAGGCAGNATCPCIPAECSCDAGAHSGVPVVDEDICVALCDCEPV